MNIYLAGPMRGKPSLGFHEFDRVTDLLRGEGHTVLSPAEMDRVDLGWPDCPDVSMLETFDLADAMRRDFAAILTVDAVVLLAGWEHSTGTAHELYVARVIGLDVFEFVERVGGWTLLKMPRTVAA